VELLWFFVERNSGFWSWVTLATKATAASSWWKTSPYMERAGCWAEPVLGEHVECWATAMGGSKLERRAGTKPCIQVTSRQI